MPAQGRQDASAISASRYIGVVVRFRAVS